MVHAEDLKVGDVIDTCRIPEGSVSPVALDDEMVGWFVGLYIAEGSRSGGKIHIAGHVEEHDRYKRLHATANAFHGTCRFNALHGNAATVHLSGALLNAILDTYVGGKTAKDKHLLPACWQRSDEFLRAVLEGYLSGDGHWRADAHRWILRFTNNDYLASDLRTVCARLGLSIRLRRCTNVGFGKKWPGWEGHITGRERRRNPDSEVIAIRQSRARQFWDIGVADEPHLFALASGVLTHNSLPESVQDRCPTAHEYLFHLVREPRYFSATDEIRERYGENTHAGRKDGGRPPSHTVSTGGRQADLEAKRQNPLGKLPGSVWGIASEPLQVPKELGVEHYAAFPGELPRRCILGWSPAGICVECGEGRRPVHDGSEKVAVRPSGTVEIGAWMHGGRERTGRNNNVRTVHRIAGYACACPTPVAPTRPARVLDPFGGTGTTPLVADVLGRDGIGVDASHDYCRLARWRVRDPAQRAKAMRVPKPAPQLDGQLGLFEGA